MIDRKRLVNRHNPVLTAVDFHSPLSVGNGGFAFTADVTGLQTCYKEYKDQHVPLCTMSQWGWHTRPDKDGRYYTLRDLEMTEYDTVRSGIVQQDSERHDSEQQDSEQQDSEQHDSEQHDSEQHDSEWHNKGSEILESSRCENKKVRYAVEKKPGNEEVYDWLRQNPHRLNLGRIAFMYDNQEIESSQIGEIKQELDLYKGILESNFTIIDKGEGESYSHGTCVRVRTICGQDQDVLGFDIESDALLNGALSVKLCFPYGSPDISASDWVSTKEHKTIVTSKSSDDVYITRILDQDTYYAALHFDTTAVIQMDDVHALSIKVNDTLAMQERSQTTRLTFSVAFSAHAGIKADCFETILQSSIEEKKHFWEHGGIIELSHSKDPRAHEIERRIILSLYLLSIQCCGAEPPQETGLTCNSWYGKFHLEMHPWHCAFLPLWNRSELLLKSLTWYKEHLPQARENAARNDYKGARWPKMTSSAAYDSPSIIATLLIWQQPHIIYMLELIYQSELKNNKNGLDLLNEYWEVVKETAEFMCDFAVYDVKTDRYHLLGPIIPAQEEHAPMITKDPVFELEYWSFALAIAYEWSKRVSMEIPQWKIVSERMAELPVIKESSLRTEESSSENKASSPETRGSLQSKQLLYPAHADCPDTFTKFNKDHPSMLAACGFLPRKRTELSIVSNTLDKVLECWDFTSMWGWDFALMAMTCVRLGKRKEAVDILLMDSPKNSYVASGNNYQQLREDLPLYLPGNGSLLLAVGLMAAGYDGCEQEKPGFLEDGSWQVDYEDILPIPF